METAETPARRCRRIAGAILYELRPFSIPSRHELRASYMTLRNNVRLLRKELTEAYHHVVEPGIGYLRAKCTWKDILGLAGGLVCYYYASRWGFGSTFFIVTVLFLIWTKGLDDTRDHRQPSAWSVFNPQNFRLLGTFTAEQYDAQLRHRDPDWDDGDTDVGGDDELDATGDGLDDGLGDAHGAHAHVQGGGSRKKGKKARRRYDKEDRQRKLQQRAQAGIGGEEDL